MKSKLMEFFCSSPTMYILSAAVVTNATGSDVSGSYEQKVLVSNQFIINT
ncbi:MAG: hypothetical protein K0R21_1781 [Anaerocolumna sp.]|jgi:hypothetical protein|nr:hypothetical protein [Anaerocolumna sp.]